jgi:hypothetical protein
MTRAAAARSLRGKTHWPTGDPEKYHPQAAHLGATHLHASNPADIKIRLPVAQSISSVRNAR